MVMYMYTYVNMCVCLCTCAASNGQFPCGKNRKTQALAMNQYCQSCKQRPLGCDCGHH